MGSILLPKLGFCSAMANKRLQTGKIVIQVIKAAIFSLAVLLVSSLSQCYRYAILLCVFKMLTFLFLNQILYCDHSLEQSRPDYSNEWSQYRLWLRLKAIFAENGNCMQHYQLFYLPACSYPSSRNTTWAMAPEEAPRDFLHRMPEISSPSSINT